MRILLPPIRYQTLAEVSTLAARWLSGFDPFGPSRTPARNR